MSNVDEKRATTWRIGYKRSRRRPQEKLDSKGSKKRIYRPAASMGFPDGVAGRLALPLAARTTLLEFEKGKTP
jgi:hypothetical protein